MNDLLQELDFMLIRGDTFATSEWIVAKLRSHILSGWRPILIHVRDAYDARKLAADLDADAALARSVQGVSVVLNKYLGEDRAVIEATRPLHMQEPTEHNACPRRRRV